MAAIANIQTGTNRILIISKLYLYGSEATAEAGDRIIEEINRMYNEPVVHYYIGEEKMKVHFTISYELISTSAAAEMIAGNQDFKNNFIRIENSNMLTRSFMGFGLGDNAGHWLTSDKLGISTTAAHEFGHGLGLDHPARTDYRGTNSPPPIMAPRGSLVDPQYQWSPLAKAGEFGGTMNPVHRKVTADEVLMILEGISFNETENNLIGRISNTFFSENGDPSNLIA